MSNVWVTGTYSIASLVGVAAESSRFNSCKFWNTGVNPAYWTGTKNLMSATTANGTLISVASANTDIHHYGSEFYNVDNNCKVVRIGNAAEINFFGGSVQSGSATGCQLVYLDTDTTTFYGRLNFWGVLFEGGTGYQVYFGTGSDMTYYNLIFRDNFFNCYDAGCKVFGYVDNTVSIDQLIFTGNRIASGYSDIDVMNLVDSTVENLSEEATITVTDNTYVQSSLLRAKIVDWGTGYGVGARVILDNATTYGLHSFGPLPNSNSGETGGTSRGSTLQLKKQAAPPAANNKVVGGLYMVDAPTWNPVGVTPTDNTPFPVYWDGTQYRPMTPLPGTPDNSAVTCKKGTLLFDNAALYWCYSENALRRVAYDNTW